MMITVLLVLAAVWSASACLGAVSSGAFWFVSDCHINTWFAAPGRANASQYSNKIDLRPRRLGGFGCDFNLELVEETTGHMRASKPDFILWQEDNLIAEAFECSIRQCC